MKKLFGLMLMATMLLSASAVFADHAPPNQTVEVSISCDVPAIANIEAITINAIEAVSEAEGEMAIYSVTNLAYKPAQPQIAVYSGRGYKRCVSFSFKNSEATGWVNKECRLHKPGHNSIARRV